MGENDKERLPVWGFPTFLFKAFLRKNVGNYGNNWLSPGLETGGRGLLLGFSFWFPISLTKLSSGWNPGGVGKAYG